MGALDHAGLLRRALRCQLRAWATRTSEGVAAIDALVALAILSATIIMSLKSVETARQAAALAVETRQADLELRRMLDQPIMSVGMSSGRTALFDWRSAAIPTEASSNPAVRTCRRKIELVDRTDGRRFRAASLSLCPVIPT
jgi:hypothetical protein